MDDEERNKQAEMDAAVSRKRWYQRLWEFLKGYFRYLYVDKK